MRSLTVFSLLLLGASVFAADDKNPAFTSAADAGPDFVIQGEYVGSIGDEKWGSQVVALGNGKFDVTGFKGGLPGAGWKRGDDLKKGKGETVDGVVKLTGDDWSGTIKDGKLSITHDGKDIGFISKTERKSPTEGAKPPAGAIVLFDGSSVDQWENGKLVEGKLLGATNVKTREKFGSYEMHIEFRTPFMPLSRGQGRGNSGVYVQGRYECQVLDSFGLDGKNNECGGIYTIAEPIVNMCLPPLSWQTYDQIFTAAKYDESGKKVENARLTTKHNGVTIHDNLELPKGTPGYKNEGAEPCEIFLQDHGNPVAFRNIWVIKK